MADIRTPNASFKAWDFSLITSESPSIPPSQVLILSCFICDGFLRLRNPRTKGTIPLCSLPFTVLLTYNIHQTDFTSSFLFFLPSRFKLKFKFMALSPLSFNSLLSHDDVWAYGISFSPYLMIKYCIFLMVCHHTRCTIFVLAARIDQSINQSILIFYSLHILGTFIV